MLGRNLLAEKKGRMINTWPCASRGNAPKKSRRQPGLPEGANCVLAYASIASTPG